MNVYCSKSWPPPPPLPPTGRAEVNEVCTLSSRPGREVCKLYLDIPPQADAIAAAPDCPDARRGCRMTAGVGRMPVGVRRDRERYAGRVIVATINLQSPLPTVPGSLSGTRAAQTRKHSQTRACHMKQSPKLLASARISPARLRSPRNEAEAVRPLRGLLSGDGLQHPLLLGAERACDQSSH